MNTRMKLSVLATAVTLAVTGQVANAQNGAEKKRQATLEVVEVTARRTTENLQEVPVSVTSLGADALKSAGVSVLTEVQQFSPNTTLQNSRGTNSTLTAFIRGVGQQDPLWGYEPGVGIYIDDVYMARPQGAVLDLLNVERIEVLRGPQGTLYGKNTIGGAVKYVTKRMSGEANAQVDVTVGSYGQQDFKLTAELPLVKDKAYLGVGYADLSRDGFGEYLIVADSMGYQDPENYNKDLTAMRATLELTPTDNVFIQIAYDQTEDDSNAKGGYRLLPSLLTNAPVPGSVFDSYTSMPTDNYVELKGFSLTAEWNVSDELTVKYIGASRESYSDTNIDFDNTPLDIFDVPAFYDDENTSHELQFSYAKEGYSVVGGIYSYDGESCGHFDAILGFLGRAAYGALGATGLTREVTGCNNSKSTAVYAQSSIELSDQWSVTIGARYTEEEKDAYVKNGVNLSNVYPNSGWIPGYVRPATAVFPQVLGRDTNGDGVLDAPKSEDWDRVTPRIGVEYQMDDQTMIYASYGQGFKSGTFNPRATVNESAADPEIVDSLEVGIKKDWGASLRTNVTVFTIDHQDRQYITVTPDPSDPSALNQNLGNIKGSTVDGLEAEIVWAASDALSVDVALGILDGKIENDPTIAAPLVGLSNTPDYTLNVGATYYFDTAMGNFTARANYYYRDDYILFEDSDLLAQDGYGMVNLGLTWESLNGDVYGGLYVKNATDEEYMVGGYNFVGVAADGSYLPGLGGDQTLVSYYGDPRTIQLNFGYRF